MTPMQERRRGKKDEAPVRGDEGFVVLIEKEDPRHVGTVDVPGVSWPPGVDQYPDRPCSLVLSG
ncbi:MAG: hypothetical protein DI547_13560 [Sphingobium sp.]|nr:MAG: hypothetical protein DI547_13560 [Sphingobium sp.]